MSHRKLSDTLEVRKSSDGQVWLIGHSSNSAVIETFRTEEEARKRLAVLDAAPELLEALEYVLREKTNSFGETPELRSEIREKIEQAIKKATE